MVEVVKLGDLIDRLCICNIKISRWNHEKLEERAKPNPDLKKLNEIQTKVDRTNEERVALKNAIDQLLKRVIETGKYDIVKEERTYEGKI